MSSDFDLSHIPPLVPPPKVNPEGPCPAKRNGRPHSLYVSARGTFFCKDGCGRALDLPPITL